MSQFSAQGPVALGRLHAGAVRPCISSTSYAIPCQSGCVGCGVEGAEVWQGGLCWECWVRGWVRCACGRWREESAECAACDSIANMSPALSREFKQIAESTATWDTTQEGASCILPGLFVGGWKEAFSTCTSEDDASLHGVRKVLLLCAEDLEAEDLEQMRKGGCKDNGWARPRVA